MKKEIPTSQNEWIFLDCEKFSLVDKIICRSLRGMFLLVFVGKRFENFDRCRLDRVKRSYY